MLISPMHFNHKILIEKKKLNEITLNCIIDSYKLKKKNYSLLL